MAYDDGTITQRSAQWHKRDRLDALRYVYHTEEQFRRNGGYTDAETKRLSVAGRGRAAERNAAIRREDRAYVRTLK